MSQLDGKVALDCYTGQTLGPNGGDVMLWWWSPWAWTCKPDLPEEQ